MLASGNQRHDFQGGAHSYPPQFPSLGCILKEKRGWTICSVCRLGVGLAYRSLFPGQPGNSRPWIWMFGTGALGSALLGWVARPLHSNFQKHSRVQFSARRSKCCAGGDTLVFCPRDMWEFTLWIFSAIFCSSSQE